MAWEWIDAIYLKFENVSADFSNRGSLVRIIDRNFLIEKNSALTFYCHQEHVKSAVIIVPPGAFRTNILPEVTMTYAKRFFLTTGMVCIFLALSVRGAELENEAKSTFMNRLWAYAPPVIPAASAASSALAFMGFACAGGVCPAAVVATGTGGLMSVAGIGALIGQLSMSTSDACFDGYSLECITYLAVPAIVGGVGGYVVVKVYDRNKKRIIRWLRTISAQNNREY